MDPVAIYHMTEIRAVALKGLILLIKKLQNKGYPSIASFMKNYLMDRHSKYPKLEKT